MSHSRFRTGGIDEPAAGHRQGHFEQSRWLLTFEDADVESGFWAFNLPRFPTSDTVVQVVTAVLVIAILLTTDFSVYDPAYATIMPLCMFLIIIMMCLQVGTHALHLCDAMSLQNATRLSRYNTSTLNIIGIVTTSLAIYASEYSGRCEIMSYVDDKRKAYFSRNCHVMIQGFTAVYLTLMVQFRFSLCAVLFVSCVSTVLTAAISVGYGSAVGPSHVQVPNTFFIGAFTVFVRYHREKVEREHFVARETLADEIRLLQSRRNEIESLCRMVIPPFLLSHAKETKRGHVDHSSQVAVLTVCVHDFGRHCTADMPLNVAHMVEEIRAEVTRLVDESELQCVNFVQDQMTAVGNLLKPMNTVTALYRCCDVGLQVCGSTFTSKGAFEPQLQAAVHLGPAAGGFIGKQWIRYDVIGDGIDQCRTALTAAEAGTVVITEDAYQRCNEYIKLSGSVAHVDGELDSQSTSSETIGLHVVIGVSDPKDLPEAFCADVSNSESPRSPSVSVSPRAAKSASFDGVHALVEAKMMLDIGADLGTSGLESAGSDSKSDGQFSMKPQWGILDRFVDDGVENDFLDKRIISFVHETARTWLAFAWIILLYFIALVVDFVGTGAPYAAVLLIVCTLLSTAAACFPVLVSQRTLLQFHMIWSSSALLVPLIAIFACAIARPSIIGNDMKVILMLGTFVRSTCFRETKYQLIAKPVMLVLSQLHVLLPGAKIRAPTPLAYFVVLWSIIIDRDEDRDARRRYIVDLRMQEVHESLQEERRVRGGLLRSTMPPKVYKHITMVRAEESGYAVAGVPDTAVMLVSQLRRGEGSASGSALSAGNSYIGGGGSSATSVSMANDIHLASRQLEMLERTLEEYPRLTLCTMFADVAVVVSPVAIPGVASRTSQRGEHIAEAVSAATQIAALGDRNVLLEMDLTLQVTRVRGVPSFSIYGPGMSRMLAVHAAVDKAALHGAVVTDRIISIAGELGLLHELDQSPLGRMKVRGAGMLRLTRLNSRKDAGSAVSL